METIEELTELKNELEKQHKKVMLKLLLRKIQAFNFTNKE